MDVRSALNDEPHLLQQLDTTLKTSQKGFEESAELVNDQFLQFLFRQYARYRQQYQQQLGHYSHTAQENEEED